MLLKCQGLCIERALDLVVEGLDIEVDAVRLALVGDFTPIFSVLTGAARVVSGVFEVEGRAGHSAVRDGDLGLVLADDWTHPRWTVLDALDRSARLAGLPKRAARSRADAVLERLELSGLAERRLTGLASAELRGVELAQAILTDPEVIAAQAPFRGLGVAARDWLWALFERAAQGRKLIVSFDGLFPQDHELISEVRARSRVSTRPSRRDGLARRALRSPELPG